MLELAPLALLTAALVVWLTQQHPPALAFAGAPVTGDRPAPGAPKEKRPAWHDLLMAKKGGGGGGSAPAPDPRIGQAALQNVQLGRQWKALAEKQFTQANRRQAGLDKLTKRIGNQQLATQDQANRWAREDRKRYEDTFQPLEDRFVEEAEGYDSDERQAARAAEAKADVLGNADQQRQSTERNLASMGVDPRSGRFQAIQKAGEQDTALAAAGAQNVARQQVRDRGLALRADAANMGRGLPSQAASGAALGLQAGNSAQSGAQTNMNSWRNNTGIMAQGYQGAMAGNSSGAGILNTQHQNKLSAWQTEQQASAANTSGLMGAVGQGLGAYAAFASSKKVKTDKRPVDGEALDKVQNMPVEAWRYKEGEGDGGEHVGPYAEDFHRETGQGDGKSIPIQDMLGLQLKAIQELGLKVDRLESQRGKGRVIDGDYEVKERQAYGS